VNGSQADDIVVCDVMNYLSHVLAYNNISSEFLYSFYQCATGCQLNDKVLVY
jgi:hypothetical protein